MMRKSPLLRGAGMGGGSFGGRGAGRLSGEDAMACQHDPGRETPTPCNFFILDVSEMARKRGLPTCSEVGCPASFLFIWAPTGFMSGIPRHSHILPYTPPVLNRMPYSLPRLG